MIGLFGGTFDPIHFGHLRVALDVVQHLDLEQLRLLPLAAAVHRRQPLASPEQRMAMLQAAIRDEPCLVADDRELKRGGPSYTVDTLVAVREELSAQAPLCLLVGADAFEGLPDWHRPLDILELVHLVVMQRPGAPTARDPWLREQVEQRRTDHPAALRLQAGGLIYFQTVTQLDISATRIRRLLARGKSPRYLLPDAVLAMARVQDCYAVQQDQASSTL
ncbi:MAG: nicotinate-nucleotide adenylyltransferase [Lamprobacter sp.]|uniref:nicotinate-nucleotide adenylyltransferase n=1 Tax=Lamprobacter sp. TaxID=3100796 RepID=UPI002B26195F|nr:nicotinate-nucleotide adenylyltransferase [Lamprobacter sp.]MEA3638439.1 nicotinate-nucleotide adenylyltransferase [Lamprobacter sp.]